ncbi:hypothetical protein [Janthinobacterium sp. B9-8]|uniref:hypothetical protein n=1 Tax=Janthinobacterium sp. B9-8 TaxID=1236179 RepID=UPI00061D2BE6|nr:hypothetical protein [Janthinobacterium sp. B9-8]AMC34752.1 hypothetical protein VN23_09090 [Janthinobacterium sp. B9-8]
MSIIYVAEHNKAPNWFACKNHSGLASILSSAAKFKTSAACEKWIAAQEMDARAVAKEWTE